jgi:cell division protein FtsQ
MWVTVAAAVVIAAGALAAWLLLWSSVFGVRSVQVSGTGRLSRGEVLAAAAIVSGTPLARVDTGAIEARLRALPVVAAATVTRNWPSGVAITVRERTPAAVRLRGSTYVLVDRTGVSFAEVGHRPRSLPLVIAPPKAGTQAVKAALDVLDAVPRSVHRRVISVRAATPEDVTLHLTHDRTVVWGSPQRTQRKAAVLAVLMTRKAAVYDVSAPDNPTTTRG